MDDENPLWYDYDLADEPPAPGLLLLAALFSIAVAAAGTWARLDRLPDRLWRSAARTLNGWPRSRPGS